MELSLKQRIISSILKLIVIIAALIGIILSARSGIDAFMGASIVFMYFTIQSNIAILLVSLIGLYFIYKNKYNYIWSVIKFVFVVSITLTGIVFCFVLAPTMGGNAFSLENVLTHVVVPLSAIIDFFVVGINFNIKKKNILFVTIPPLLYSIYAGIGYALDFKFTSTQNYPYFFLNWGSKAGAIGFSSELPFMGVIWWILLLLLFLIFVGFIYLKIIDLFKNKYKK